MATGFGVDPTVVNNVVTGTTSQDIRKVIEGMFANQGILRGCKVTTRSDLKYNVSLGAVVCEVSEGESILVPVYASTPATTPPTSGSRTDYIIVTQNMPAINGNSNIVVSVTNTEPSTFSRSMVLAKYTAVAGKTRTSDFVEAPGFYRNYAVPTHTAGRYLFQKTEVYNDLIKPKKDLPIMSGSFTLETDRLIEITLGTTVDCDFNNGIQDCLYAIIFIDGIRRATFSSGKIDDGWSASHSWVWNTELEAGYHTFKIQFEERGDTGKLRVRYSSAGGFPGTTCYIKDLGVKD